MRMEHVLPWDIFFGVETVKRFVNIYLHCNVSNLKNKSQMSTLFPPGKIIRRPWLLSPFQQALTYGQVRLSEPCSKLKTKQNVLWRHNRSWIVYFFFHNCLKMDQICTLFCSFTLFILDSWMFNVISISKMNNLTIQEFSRTTRYFSRIKDIMSFDSKFKDSSWRSMTSGNLRLFTVLCLLLLPLFFFKWNTIPFVSSTIYVWSSPREKHHSLFCIWSVFASVFGFINSMFIQSVRFLSDKNCEFSWLCFFA